LSSKTSLTLIQLPKVPVFPSRLNAKQVIFLARKMYPRNSRRGLRFKAGVLLARSPFRIHFPGGDELQTEMEGAERGAAGVVDAVREQFQKSFQS
jgi:hypothetical protein